MMQIKGKKALTVLIAAAGINLVSGIIYCWSIISKELISSLQWTNTEANLPYAASVLMVAVFMAIGGRLRDIIGPRTNALIGGSLLGAGLFLSSYCTTAYMMFITYGLVAGIGMGFTGSSTTVTAIKWFPAERRGVVSGICLSGIALASVYISPILNALIASFGVHKTFQYIGCGAFVVIILLALLLAEPTGAAQQAGPVESEWKDTLKKSGFYKLWFMYLLGSSVGLIILGNIAVIAVRQAGWEDGFLLVILIAVFNGSGRILSGAVSDKIGFRNTFIIALLAQAVNMIFFNYYRTVRLLAIGTAVAGFCYGGMISVVPAAVAFEFGTKNLGVNYGLITTAYGVAGIFGPLMAGRIVDMTGSFHFAFLTSAVMLITAAIIISTLKKRKNLEIVVQ